MKSNEAIKALAVFLHGRQIGIINKLANEKTIFAFEADYVNDANRSTLSLSFKDQLGELIPVSRVANVALPPFFSNLLPEGHLRTYLAEKAGVHPEREFFLLAALGADLPGAVTVKPIVMVDNEMSSIEDNVITSSTQSMFRFSLAGIQLKFSAVMEASGGLTISADGENGTWILKLPSARFSSVPENEFTMLHLAKAIGISVPEIKLIKHQDVHGLPQEMRALRGNILAVKRFDRQDQQRIHMEDFAQVFGIYPKNKYEKRSYANIAAVLWAEAGEVAAYEFLRRLVFSILIGNADMHLKNWSILYRDERIPELSPAYDFVATLPYIENDTLALGFGGSKRLDEITADQLRRFAAGANMPVSPIVDIVKETQEQVMAAWKSLPEKALLTSSMVNSIQKQLNSVKLFL